MKARRLGFVHGPDVRSFLLDMYPPPPFHTVQAEEKEEAQEEFGWKLVHGDVFRPPTRPMLLSVLLGNGVQLLLMAIVTLFFACLGFLSPGTPHVCLWMSGGAGNTRQRPSRRQH